MAEDYYSFDEALDQLRLKEEELKRLVSEGEIRAFREGDTMKLRRQDVESLRAELGGGGEVVDLGVGAEELVFEDETGLEDDTGMATQEIADVETLIEEEVEDVGELELDEDVEEVRPARRAAAAVVVVAEDTEEETWVKVALIVSAVILILGLPVALSLASGNLSSTARSIAGMFPGTEGLPQPK